MNSLPQYLEALQQLKKPDPKFENAKWPQVVEELQQASEILQEHLPKWQAARLQVFTDTLIESKPLTRGSLQGLGIASLQANSAEPELLAQLSLAALATRSRGLFLSERQLPWPGKVMTLAKPSSEILEMLMQHPSVISLMVSEPAKILPFGKKRIFRLSSLYNTAIVMKDADLQVARDQIAAVNFSSEHGSLDRFHRVLVHQSLVHEFQQEMQSLLQVNEGVNQPGALETVAALQKDEGRLLAHTEIGFLIRDVSFCSTYQQEPHDFCGVITCEFKYNHELVKWVNTGYLDGRIGFFTQNGQKAQELFERMHKSQMTINEGLQRFPLSFSHGPPRAFDPYFGSFLQPWVYRP